MVPTAASPPERPAHDIAARVRDCRGGRAEPPRGTAGSGEKAVEVPVLIVSPVAGPRMSCRPVAAAVGEGCGLAAAPHPGHEESVVLSGVMQPVQYVVVISARPQNGGAFAHTAAGPRLPGHGGTLSIPL
jgi:hypothetical protein